MTPLSVVYRNASGNAWVDGLTIAQGGNVTVYNNLTVNNAATVTNDLTVNGNTYLGNAGGDTVFVNDIIRIGATDSGDASLFFGEGSVAGSDYGARWYWDSGYTFTWYTRNAGTDTALFDYVTNDTTYLNWRRHFHMQNKEINCDINNNILSAKDINDINKCLSSQIYIFSFVLNTVENVMEIKDIIGEDEINDVNIFACLESKESIINFNPNLKTNSNANKIIFKIKDGSSH